MKQVADLIDAYVAARDEHDRLKDLKTRAYDAQKAAETELIDAMLDQGLPQVKTDEGLTVSLRKDMNFSCTKDNFTFIREWLREEMGDDLPYVEEVVSKSALTELLKGKIEEGTHESEFPPFLRLSTRPGLSVRGLKARSEA